MSISSIPRDNIIKGSFLRALAFQQRISITDIFAIESTTRIFQDDIWFQQCFPQNIWPVLVKCELLLRFVTVDIFNNLEFSVISHNNNVCAIFIYIFVVLEHCMTFYATIRIHIFVDTSVFYCILFVRSHV